MNKKFSNSLILEKLKKLEDYLIYGLDGLISLGE